MRAACHRCCDRLTRSRVAPRQERDKLRLAKMMKFGDKVRARRMLSPALRCRRGNLCNAAHAPLRQLASPRCSTLTPGVSFSHR